VTAGEVAVRPATLADVDAMSETAIAAWREGFRGLVPDHVGPERSWSPDRLEERLRAGNDDDRELLVAELEGRVAGLVLLGRCRDAGAEPDEGEVIALYVHPDHWRSGAGSGLVRAALDRLREIGCTEAIVWTLAESPRNLAFYESLGFSRDGGTQRRESFGSPLEVRFRLSL
jgi:GNAT superfamily N-acetyltransferase